MGLAVALDDQGRHAEAEMMHRDTLAVEQRVLGPEHPDTLLTAMSLANALTNQGKHAEAKTMHLETLAVQQHVLGPEHPDTLRTTQHLAACVRSTSAIVTRSQSRGRAS
jgi:hypothetical protein